jgi:hypothetical protein
VSHSVVNAVIYLQLTSLRNRIVQRLKRLRQPKYLLGAIVGGAYLYFFLFRRVFNPPMRGDAHVLPPDLLPIWLSLAALLLMVIVLLAWLVPSKRAALKFTEAETAFLFPAPLSRRMLIHFQLYRSQLGIFFSAFVMSLVFRRSGPLAAASIMHAAGWWLLLSTISLHFIGASFTRERLLELGIGNARRRWLIGGGVLLVSTACVLWLRGSLAPPSGQDLADARSMMRYLSTVFAAAPVGWLLAPFRVLVQPVFATDAGAFVRTFLPALGLLVAHYFWVVRSNVAFEEASLEGARRQAERRDARRTGKRPATKPGKARSAPFRLAPSGFVPTAFLWKNLIALGPFYRLRTWLIACAIVLIGGRWLAANPDGSSLLHVFASVAVGLGVGSVFAGPMLMQRGLQQTLEYMDVLKASPLRGWQIVLGELLSPMAVMTFVQWLLLLVVAMSSLVHADSAWLTATDLLIAAFAVLLLVPPLSGLLLCVPFTGLLYFPAWTSTMSSRSGGIEATGQRMIFMGAYLVVTAIALVPAAVLAALAFLLGRWLGNFQVGAALAVLIAGAALVVEMLTVVWWLGERVERFDLSLEGQPG